jgi:hypothetical protein
MKPKLLTNVFRAVERDDDAAEATPAPEPRRREDRRRVRLHSAVRVPTQHRETAPAQD